MGVLLYRDNAVITILCFDKLSISFFFFFCGVSDGCSISLPFNPGPNDCIRITGK